MVPFRRILASLVLLKHKFTFGQSARRGTILGRFNRLRAAFLWKTLWRRKVPVSRLSYFLRMRTLGLLFLLTMALAGCSNEPEYSDPQRACIAKLYSSYDAKQMNQCVNVCKSCMGGSTVTCTTSCNLKGAR